MNKDNLNISLSEFWPFCLIGKFASVMFGYINPSSLTNQRVLPDGNIHIMWPKMCVIYRMTSSNGNIPALLAICAGNSPVTDEFPSQRPVTRSFNVFFDLHPNKRFSKQSWGRRFETPSRSLWRHCNESWNKATLKKCWSRKYMHT